MNQKKREIQECSKINPKTICQICGHPSVVHYTEKDEDTGKLKECSHIVPCLGHYDVHPSFQNLHKEFDAYEKFRVKQKRQLGQEE